MKIQKPVINAIGSYLGNYTLYNFAFMMEVYAFEASIPLGLLCIEVLLGLLFLFLFVPDQAIRKLSMMMMMMGLFYFIILFGKRINYLYYYTSVLRV